MASLFAWGARPSAAAWEIGALLSRAHALAEHGTWYDCLNEFGISPQSAGRWRKLDDQYATADELEGNYNTIHAALTAVQPLSADREAGQPSTGGYPEWYTPAEIVEAARATMDSIDLDPTSCEAANENVKAKRFFAKDDDVLNQTWKERVWLNPPDHALDDLQDGHVRRKIFATTTRLPPARQGDRGREVRRRHRGYRGQQSRRMNTPRTPDLTIAPRSRAILPDAASFFSFREAFHT